MLSSISQNSYQYENENTLGESVIDSCNNILSSSKDTIRHNQHANNNNNNRDDKFRLNTTDIDLTTNSTQRENNFQLQQHEREQHLHQLQSINNMLLDNNNQTNSYSAINSSGTMKNTNSAGMDDITITDLLGLGITRGGLLGSNQRDHQGNMNNYNSSPYRSYQNYEDSVYSPSSSSNFDVPSSPSNSFQTSMTPSTPGSSYTTPYSNSSVPNSPYTTISNGTNSIGRSNHQYPVSSSRSSSCYGRPIRGSPPYSDCESPSIEYPPYMFGCNGARSQSPSGSDQSGNSFDGAQLSDIMNYLSLNSMPRPCHPSSLSTMMSDPEKCCSKRTPLDIHKLKKFLHTSEYQHQQPINRYHYHHGHVTSHNRHFNQHHISQKIHPEKICCSGSNYRVNNISSPSPYSPHDKPTHWQRNSSDSKKVKYTWSGQFSKKNVKAIGYSTKVFLGGTPWDIKESDLISAFKEFGQVKVEWPPLKNGEPQKGFAYIIMESEKQVKALLSNCTQEYKDGGNCFYFKMSSKRMRGKEVEVIPWAINNSNYVKNSSQKLDGDKTVFVGALHGMMTAINLAAVMNDLFDNVVYAGIDTERNKYPIGSARVTFCNRQSYLKAIEAGFVEIKTDKFRKIIQIDPYLEESPCSRCFVQQGPYFCREMTCFKYYCHTCWQWQHSSDAMNWHEPMSRGLKNSQVIGFNKSPNPMHSVKNFSV